MIGESEKKDAAGYLTISVLDLGKTAGLGLEEMLGNIHKVFGVLHVKLEELKEFFNNSEIVFGDVFLRSPSRTD